MNFDKSNSYNELSIIINHQEILSQKVGILLAINTLIIGSMISLAIGINYWIVFSIIPSLISLLICVYILFPNFKSSNNSKYFYDFANMQNKEIISHANDKLNTIEQIKINSVILRKKYGLFKHSLAITFIGFPYVYILINNIRKRK